MEFPQRINSYPAKFVSMCETVSGEWCRIAPDDILALRAIRQKPS
jgi:hypothetical protein